MTTMIKRLYKFFLTFFIFCSFGLSISTAQNCSTPTALNSSSISNFTATLNWNIDTSAHHYRVRYKQSGSSSWNFKYGIYTNSETINGLLANTAYVWQVRAFCSAGNSISSWWSSENTFTTSNFPVDCNNTPNGSAYTDSCGNCVGGTTGNLPCISFSPTVSISLSNIECDSYSDIIFFTSQDPNEPDISSTVFTSDSGSFDFNGLNTNDTIGSSNIIAGGGFISVSTFLLVDFVINSNRISVKAVDSITGTIYGSFTLENTNPGVMVIAASLPDNNNVTSGNSNEIFLDNLFLNPNPGTIVFTSTINSELGDVDIQTATQSIHCVDCNGDLGGTAYIDSCGNCVGGNTGDLPCIPFTPTVTVSISNTDCDSLTDLTITVSQDPNEPDMSTSLFASDNGSFTINTMSIGDTIGTASMTLGNASFNTVLIVNSIVSNNQVIIQSIASTGLVMGTFTISNNNPGISITAQSIPDGNNVTSGNSQIVTFNNVFLNPGSGTINFTTTINSETGDTDIQTFIFQIQCLCVTSYSTITVDACDSYTWPINNQTYTSSGVHIDSITNTGGCDSIITLNLTINNSDATSSSETACDSYTWDGVVYTSSGTYLNTYTNVAGCDSIHTLNLTINSSDSTNSSETACDSYSWDGVVYTSSGTYSNTYTNAAGCDSVHTLNLIINISDTSINNVTICGGYLWNGMVYMQSGTYTYNTTSLNGCDSIAILNLTVNNSSISFTGVTACNSYDWNGTTYTQSGVYSFHTINSNGCDSTANLALVIFYTDTTSTNVSSCSSYSWEGQTISQSGTLTHTYTNTAGCDSVHIVNVTITNPDSVILTITSNGSYDFNGTVYDSSGVYSWIGNNSNGCDSVVILNLSVLHCHTPTNLLTSNILLDRVTLNWDAVSGADHYDVLFSADGISWQYIPYIYSTSRTKSGLSPGNTYYWRVRSVCSPNDTSFVSQWSAIDTLSTPDLCTTPNNTSSSSIGLTSAVLTWDPITNISEYVVRIKRTNQPWSAWAYDTVSSNTYTAINLNSASTYHWQVRAICFPIGSNNSSFSSYTVFNTLTPCPNPNGLTIDSVSVSSAYLSWNPVSGAHHYLVLYSEQGSNTWSSQVTTNSSITLSGLLTYHPYVWKLLVYCDPNGLNNSDTITGPNFSTANPCTAPNNLSVSNILLDRFTMNWDAVSLANRYEIRIREVGSIWDTITNVFGTSRTKSNLNSATTYEWQIRSICNSSGSSFSDWSPTQTITTLTPCAVPNNLSSSNVLLTTANLSWDAVPGAWAYRVRYRVSGSWTIDTTYTNSISLSNLSNSSTYSWQVKSMCDPSGINNSVWTSVQNFTTLTPCANPHSFSVSQITLNSAKLSWSGPNNPYRYYVWYKGVNDSLWIQLTILPSFINGTNAYKTVTGLNPATTYEWKVQSNCLSNNTNLSDTVYAGTFTTDTPCAIPTNLISSVNGNSVTLNWDAVTGALNYTLKVRPSGSGAWTTYNPPSNSKTINGLIFGVVYEWKVLSNCNNLGTNSSVYSSIETFTTGSCPDVQNISVTNIQIDRAKINWTFNSSVHHYEIRAREVGTTVWTKFIQNIYASNRTIVGLSDGISYEVQVRATCTVDTSSVSSWSPSTVFTTLIDCSIKPSNITTSNITLSSIDFAFTGSPNAVQYVVRFRKSSTSIWDYDTLTAPTTIFTKSGLDANSTYYYQIRSICSSSPLTQSGWTTIQSENTLQPCGNPSGLTVLNNQATPTSIKFKWNRSSVYSYTVILKDVTSLLWDTIVFINSAPITGVSSNSIISGLTISANISGSEIRVAFGGLNPSTTYEWKVMGQCLASGINNTPFVSGPNATTLDPCLAPVNLSASVSGNSVTLNWDAVTGALNYTLKVRPSGSGAWTTYNPPSNSKTINGLIFGVVYEWKVLSNCNNLGTNSSVYSSIETFTTGSCPDVQNISVTNIQIDRAKINWTFNSSVHHYEIRAREVGTTVWTKFIQNIYASNRTIVGLSDGISYEVQVRATCTVDTSSVSSWSPSTVFTTLIDCSIKPSNITTSNITLSSIDFAFTGSPNAVQYVVRFRKSSTSIWDYDTLTAPTTIFTKSGLDANSTYYYQIRSICSSSPLTQSGWTTIQSENTLVPCAEPNSLTVFNNQITKNTFKVEWKRVGSVYAYNVILKDVTSSVWDTVLFINSTPISGISINSAISGLTVSTTLLGSKIRVEFGGLSASTTYEWQVQSVCLASGINNSSFVAGTNITTLDPCATPVGLFTNNITNTSAKLNWLATSNALTYQIRAREVGTSLWTKNVSGITSNSRSISNLSDGVSYEWQVRGICSTDTSDVSPWSSLANFSTPVFCIGAPSNANTSNISLNQATLNWNVHPSAQVYVLRFRHSSTSVWTYDTLASTSITKTGLLQQATYYWQVRSICDLTNNIFGPWSTLRSFNTLAPCAPPTNLATYNNQSTLTTAKVSWKGPNANTYFVIFKEINSSSWDTLLIGSGSNPSVTPTTSLSTGVSATASNSGNTKTLNFVGLTAGTTYEWKVVSLCTSSNLSQSVSGNNFTTLAPCPDPTGLSSTPLVTSSIVSWNAVSGAVKYELRKRLLGSNTWGNSIILTNTSRNFSNLTPGSTYEWQVRSYCDNSGTNVSNWVTATLTTQNVCTKPTNPFVNNITSTSATLNWDATPTGAWGYRIQYLVDGAPFNTKITDTSNVNWLDISSLTPSTTYKWRVKAICDPSGSNTSPWKQWQFFTTPSGIRIYAGDVSLSDNLTVYPNPTRGVFSLTYTTDKDEGISVEVIDAFGKRIFNDNRPEFSGEYNKQIDLSNYPKGIYIVQIYTGTSYVSKRLVVQ